MAAKEQLSERVTVSRRAAEGLRAGAVWVYRGEIERGAGEPGGLVEVVDGRGVVLGTGTYSASSMIAVRLVSREGGMDRAAFLALVRERVVTAVGRREALGEGVVVGRVVFSEADGLPGVVVDRYGEVAVLQLLTQGMAQGAVRETIAEALQAAWGDGVTLWERSDPRIRELEELPAPGTEALFGPGVGRTVFRLNGLGFEFDVAAGQKTGAFLDQRLNYLAAERVVGALGGVAAGRALDVCTYQGGFALHLARVCGRVTGVDASRAALEAADRNLLWNREREEGLRAEVDWVEADAFALLRAWDEAGERFGTVVLDPPAFAKTRNAVAGAMRGYKEMNLRALKMLEPGGVLVTCSCSHHVSEASLREVLGAAAADAGRRVQVLESRGAAPDHPEVVTLPETRYLKCLVCRVD